MKKYINLLLILSFLPAINGNADNLSLLNEGKSWVYDVIFTYDDFFATSIEDSLIPTLIDEDKIWEYYRVGYVEDKGSTDQILTRYGFDGTREVNGKTYHRLMLVSVDKWRYNSFTGYFPYGSPTSIPEHKEVNECVALMREEAGKVYLYMDTDNKSSLQKYESKNNAPLYATVPDSKEVLVYDFSLSVGDEMDHWLVIDTGSWKPEEEWTFDYRDPRFGGTMITSQIAAIESIDGGKMGTLRKLHVNREDSQVNYVEKVGPTGYGNLFFLAGGPNLYDHICGTVVMFNNLYDRSGNVLYPGKGINVPSESDMGLLREDRKWDYTIEYRTFFGTSTFTSEGYHMASIEEPYSGGFFTFIHPDGTTLATVRQDKSKVWLQVMEDMNIQGLDGKLIPKYEDVLLYDFSLKTGDRFECAGFDYSDRPNGRMMDCVITDTYDVEYNGRKLRCQEFRVEGEPEDDTHIYRAVEGVGNLRGLLPFPQFGVWEDGPTQEVAYVRYLRDMKGNIVYEGDPTSGIGTVLEDITRNSENRYDLFGRRIREAAPGQIYLENGRKRVGR